MTVTMKQVRAALDPDEPRYAEAVRRLGPDALPHLEEIIRESNAGLAAKAVYLASLIQHERSAAVVALGMERPESTVRVAVASGARNLAPRLRSPLLLRLLDHDHVGIRKFALRAVPSQPEPSLAAKVEALTQTEPEPTLRSLAREVLDQGA